MFTRLKYWWINHLPFITTKRRQDEFVIGCMMTMEKVDKKSNWTAINPVIFSLKELRNNTWDVERVDHAIKWLEDNFKVETPEEIYERINRTLSNLLFEDLIEDEEIDDDSLSEEEITKTVACAVDGYMQKHINLVNLDFGDEKENKANKKQY